MGCWLTLSPESFPTKRPCSAKEVSCMASLSVKYRCHWWVFQFHSPISLPRRVLDFFFCLPAFPLIVFHSPAQGTPADRLSGVLRHHFNHWDLLNLLKAWRSCSFSLSKRLELALDKVCPPNLLHSCVERMHRAPYSFL